MEAVITAMGGAVVGSFVTLVFTKWIPDIRNRRARRREKKIIEDADEFIFKVRLGELYGMYIAQLQGLIIDRLTVLWHTSRHLEDMFDKDYRIVEWTREKSRYEKMRRDAEDGLEPDCYNQYTLEYASGKFIVDWEAEMSPGFWEMYKTRIKNIKQKIATPIQLPDSWIMDPRNRDPMFPPHLVIEDEDGSYTHFMDGLSPLPDWVKKLNERRLQ